MGSELSVSGGIAIPSSSTALMTNPAGLVLGKKKRVVVQAAANDIWSETAYRVGAMNSNESYSFAVLVDHDSYFSSARTGARYGLAVGTEKMSFGFSGYSILRNGSGSYFNLGLLLNPGEELSFGAVMKGLGSGYNEFGLGATFAAGKGFAIVLDGVANSDFSQKSIKPGIKVGTQSAALSVSYGTDYTQSFDYYWTFAGSTQIDKSVLLEFYYNYGSYLYNYAMSCSVSF